MRVLTKSSVSLFEATSAGASDSQVVPAGSSCVVRGFSAEHVGLSSQSSNAVIEWRNGDSSGPVGIKYQMPFFGSFNIGVSFGSRNPTHYIEVPGIGVRFGDGLHLRVTIDVGSGLTVLVTTIYT